MRGPYLGPMNVFRSSVVAAFLCGAAPVSADCVILLHGLARSEASFLVMEAALEREGYRVVRPGYPSTRKSVSELARETLPAAFEQCGAETSHIVSHSMGGILTRLYLAETRPETLGRVVMLGPPNHGSELVDELGDWALFELLNGPAGMELGTGDGALIQQLPPVDYPLGVIAGTRSLNPLFSALIPGKDDGKVSVKSTAAKGMTAQIVLPVTHTFMMNDPVVIAQVVHFLSEARFDPSLGWRDGVFGTTEQGKDKR